MALSHLMLVGVFLTIFGGGEYPTKLGNIFYQPTLPGYNGPPPLITGKVINNCNDPQFGGVVGIDMSNPTSPTKVSFLQAPHNVAFGGVDSVVLENGMSAAVAGNVPCFAWSLLPDVDETLNPPINGKIQGRGGATWWDVSDPANPQLLPDITVDRNSKSLKRRELLLATGANVTDITTGLTFAQSEHPFFKYVFQSSDDAAIRAQFFKQDSKDYVVINTISGDTGLAIFDVTLPSFPVQVLTYNPYMNYLLKVKDVCASVLGNGETPAYSNRYYEKLNPGHNPNDRECVELLNLAYWNGVNDKSFPASDGVHREGVANSINFHTKYLPDRKAMLVSSNSDFFYVDVTDLNRPEIVFNLADRTRFPTLSDGNVDLVQYYTKNGREVAAGYHVADAAVVDNKLIVSIDHDNYYINANGYLINTGVSTWDFTNPANPQLLSFIECQNEECHAVRYSELNGQTLLYVTSTGTGIKVYDMSNPSSPQYITGESGTIILRDEQGNPVPGVPPISYPNPASGFELTDFFGYPEPFRTFSFITNLPGNVDIVPYQFAPLMFDVFVDGDLVIGQGRNGVTYVYEQVQAA